MTESFDVVFNANPFHFKGKGEVIVEQDFVRVRGKSRRALYLPARAEHQLRMVDIINVHTDGRYVGFHVLGVRENLVIGVDMADAAAAERLAALLPQRRTEDFAVAHAEREEFHDRIDYWSPSTPVIWGLLTLNIGIYFLTGADIRAWLKDLDLPWIEDPTNENERYTRNRIRAVLLPALERTFPQFRATFARSIGHAAQAQELLSELAGQDVAGVGNPPRIAELQALSRARQANVLRHWLMQAHGCAPSAAQLEQLLDQVRACTTRGHRIHLKVARGFVERRGDFLHWYNSGPSPKASR